MKVLSEKEFADVVAWTPSGKAFNIIQPKLFTANILPSHFKQAKYSSFTRKLHRWGFMRHYRGPEAGAFFHKHFRRGRMDLVEKMTCAKPGAPSSGTKSNTSRAAAANNDNAPAMGMMMDTSASSRESGNYGANSNNLMGTMMGHTLGLPQLQGAANFNALMQQQQIPQQFLMQGFGAMPSPAQQQMFLQQQQQQQQQQLQQQQMAAAQGGATTGDNNGLDAAIELEVTRRLKERINAAAFSRQALSMMQQPGQQQAQGGAPGGNQQAAAQAAQLQHHQSMMQQPMMGAGHSMFGGPTGMGSPTLQGFPQGFKGFDRQALQFGMQDPFAMSSNIQGAKTA